MKITKFERNNKEYNISIDGVSSIITNILSKYCDIKSTSIYDYLIPDFHSAEGGLHPDNRLLRERYKLYTNYLFYKYSNLIGAGIPEKEARYILPLSYLNNISITCNKKELINIVSNLLVGDYSNIDEINDLGYNLKSIIDEFYPSMSKLLDFKIKTRKDFDYLDDKLDRIPIQKNNEYLGSNLIKEEYNASLITSDFKVCVYLLMKKYNMTYEAAYENTHRLMHNDINYKRRLIYHLINSEDIDVLNHINYNFEYNISLHALKELDKRDLNIPSLIPIKTNDFYIPSSLNKYQDLYISIFKTNQNMVQYFIEKGVKEDDLVYFYLGCNTLNVSTNINAKKLLELSNDYCCEKRLPEIRNITNDMIRKAKKETPIIGDFYGPGCEVEGICTKNIPCHNIDNHFNIYENKKNEYELLDRGNILIIK